MAIKILYRTPLIVKRMIHVVNVARSLARHLLMQNQQPTWSLSWLWQPSSVNSLPVSSEIGCLRWSAYQSRVACLRKTGWCTTPRRWRWLASLRPVSTYGKAKLVYSCTAYWLDYWRVIVHLVRTTWCLLGTWLRNKEASRRVKVWIWRVWNFDTWNLINRKTTLLRMLETCVGSTKHPVTDIPGYSSTYLSVYSHYFYTESL